MGTKMQLKGHRKHLPAYRPSEIAFFFFSRETSRLLMNNLDATLCYCIGDGLSLIPWLVDLFSAHIDGARDTQLLNNNLTV